MYELVSFCTRVSPEWSGCNAQLYKMQRKGCGLPVVVGLACAVVI